MIPPPPEPPLDIAVSECLTGSAVRWDGADNVDGMPHADLGGLFRLHGICPEVGIGMPTPRPPIRLVGELRSPRAQRVDDPTRDYTAALCDYAAEQHDFVATLAGYIFAANSPSCGLHTVKVYSDSDPQPTALGRGVFAASLIRSMPELPVEEGLRLFDAGVRESFIDRTFAYAHWQRLQQDNAAGAWLIEFHGCYQYLLMAHSVPHYQRAQRMISEASGQSDALTAAGYLHLLLEGLAVPASRASHCTALRHLRRQLDTSNGHLDEAIARFGRAEISRAEVVCLLNEALRPLEDETLRNQVYLTSVRI